MRMQVDAFGKIEACNSVFINDVKMDNDLSAQVYENFNQRRRYGGQRDYDDDYSHSNYGQDYSQRNYRQDYSQRNYGQNNENNQANFADNKSYQTYSVNDSQSVGTFLSSQI